MTEPVTGQFMLFFCTILTGILAGLIYEFYAGIGEILRLKRRVLAAGDFVFWLLLIAVVYALLLIYNQGEVRFFVLLGLGTGAGLYFRFLRRPARAAILLFLQQATRLLLFTWRLYAFLMAAFFFPFRMFYTILAFPFRLAGKLTGRMAGGFKMIARRVVPEPCKKLYRGIKRCWSVFRGLLKRR